MSTLLSLIWVGDSKHVISVRVLQYKYKSQIQTQLIVPLSSFTESSPGRCRCLLRLWLIQSGRFCLAALAETCQATNCCFTDTWSDIYTVSRLSGRACSRVFRKKKLGLTLLSATKPKMLWFDALSEVNPFKPLPLCSHGRMRCFDCLKSIEGGAFRDGLLKLSLKIRNSKITLIEKTNNFVSGL